MGKKKTAREKQEDVSMLAAHIRENYIKRGRGWTQIKRVLETHMNPGLETTTHPSGVHYNPTATKKQMEKHQKKETAKMKVNQLRRRLRNK